MDGILKQLKNCDEKTIKEVSRYCDEYFYNQRKEKQDEKYADNQQYVGKCYELNTKKGKRYYKVISIKGSNQFRVSCLVFDEKPSAKFSPSISKIHLYHENEGLIDFESIDVESVMIKKTFMCVSIEDMTEISEGEWRYALQRYIDQLMDFDWSKV